MFGGLIKEKYGIILFQLMNLPRELSCDEQHTFDHKYSVILGFNHLYFQLLHQLLCWQYWFAGLLGLNSAKCLRSVHFKQGNRSIKLLISLEFRYNKVLLWIPIQKEELGSKVSSHPSSFTCIVGVFVTDCQTFIIFFSLHKTEDVKETEFEKQDFFKCIVLKDAYFGNQNMKDYIIRNINSE